MFTGYCYLLTIQLVTVVHVSTAMFVADQKIVGGVKRDDAECSDSSDMDLTLKCLQEIDRQDLDFTEELWNVLRGACVVSMICLLERTFITELFDC